MDVSVIICTYNRCESLRRTLQTCCDLEIPPGLQWELVVVDNNSADATGQVCEGFASKLPLRRVFEARQGKSVALNRSLGEAGGTLLLFTDDDVDVDGNWVAAMHRASLQWPTAAFFGGRVLPRWEAPPPQWVIENVDWLHTNVHVDRGPKEGLLAGFLGDGEPPFFVGANIAFRRSVFQAGLRFLETIGPTGPEDSPSAYLRGEETDLQERFLARGTEGVYVPSALVYHRHAARRQTERYLRRYYAGSAAAEVRRAQRLPTGHYWWGAPRYLWKRLMLSGLKYLLTRPWAPARTWLAAERAAASAWGAIGECRHLSSSRSFGAR